MNQLSKHLSFFDSRRHAQQFGFSLVELMVGLVIGLIASLVIMQVFSAFEGQKRSTSGTADAQTNGSIALHHIQRDVQMAGYGLPMPSADQDNASLNCNPAPLFDHDDNPATADLDVFPLVIEDAASVDGVSDVVTGRFSRTAMGAVPVKIVNAANANAAQGLAAENNIGCRDDDIVLISQGTVCRMTRIADANGTPNTFQNISLIPATPVGAPIAIGAKIACMGDWRDYRYAIENNQLTLDGVPIVSEIVNMQAQYGISAVANSNQVVNWVNATGAWATPSVADRNRIKALRIVVVARNDLLEKEIVTTQCTTAKGVANNGPCAWDDADVDAAPAIDLSAIASWQNYRYKTYETIIPLRNMLWSKDVL